MEYERTCMACVHAFIVEDASAGTYPYMEDCKEPSGLYNRLNDEEIDGEYCDDFEKCIGSLCKSYTGIDYTGID